MIKDKIKFENGGKYVVSKVQERQLRKMLKYRLHVKKKLQCPLGDDTKKWNDYQSYN